MAKYVENTIANRDITAFFCEDKDDSELIDSANPSFKNLFFISFY